MSTRQAVSSDTAPSLVALTVMFMIFLVALNVSGLRCANFLSLLLFCISLLGYAGYRLHFTEAARTGCFVQTCTVFLAFGFLTPLTSAVLATGAQPYADDAFIAADKWLFLGFTWPWMVSWLSQFSEVLHLLSYAYVSIGWQPFLLLALLCFGGQTKNAWIVMTAWSFALLGCIAIFPLCPAQGAYAHLGISPSDMPGVVVPSAWAYPKVLDDLHRGAVTVIDDRAFIGIVAMPSFHAAASVLLAWGFRTIRLVRWPMLALNVSMFVSSVPIGGHYLVDVVAGAALAAAAAWLAVHVNRQTDLLRSRHIAPVGTSPIPLRFPAA